MRILLSNDDGIFAPGLTTLASALAQFAEVYITAPDVQRSASSHGISFRRTLYTQPVDFHNRNIHAWSVSGTPVDCVKWGIYHLSHQGVKFDLMLSGINHGYNLATDVLYSGTVAAAGEAGLQGIPAIALSLGGIDDFFFDDIVSECTSKLPYLTEIAWPPDTFLNVNFPMGGRVTGTWKVTRLGIRGYEDKFVEVSDDRGQSGYRYNGEAVIQEPSQDTDVFCVQHGDISVTPLRYHFTNEEFIDSLKSQFMHIFE